MDNTIRVTDPEASVHLTGVQAQIEELIKRFPSFSVRFT